MALGYLPTPAAKAWQRHVVADLLRGGYIAECYVPTKETFIAMTVSWLLIRIALTIFSEISFDRFTNSSAYCGVTIGKFMV